jgi:hypothetical protein
MASPVDMSLQARSVKTTPARDAAVIDSHATAVARPELVTAWPLGLALPGPDAAVGPLRIILARSSSGLRGERYEPGGPPDTVLAAAMG